MRINGSITGEGVHAVQAEVTVSVSQSDESVNFYKASLAAIEKYDKARAQMKGAEDQILASYFQKHTQLNAAKEVAQTQGDQVKAGAALEQDFANEKAETAEIKAPTDPTKFDYANNEEYIQAAHFADRPGYLAPAYRQLKLEHTIGSHLGLNALYCKRNELK